MTTPGRPRSVRTGISCSITRSSFPPLPFVVDRRAEADADDDEARPDERVARHHHAHDERDLDGRDRREADLVEKWSHEGIALRSPGPEKPTRGPDVRELPGDGEDQEVGHAALHNAGTAGGVQLAIEVCP